MRIACPQCDATYDVPDHLATNRRSLRCVRCGHAWAVTELQPAVSTAAAQPQLAAQPLTIPPRPEPQVLRSEPLVAQPESSSPQGGRLPLALAWLATLLLVGGLAVGLVLFRADIVAAWPPTARLYAALGMDPSDFRTSPAR